MYKQVEGVYIVKFENLFGGICRWQLDSLRRIFRYAGYFVELTSLSFDILTETPDHDAD